MERVDEGAVIAILQNHGDAVQMVHRLQEERGQLTGRLMNIKIDLQTGKTKQHAIDLLAEIVHELQNT